MQQYCDEITRTPVDIPTNIDLEEILDPEENWMNKNSSATSQSVVTLQKSKTVKRRSKFSVLNAQNISLCERVPLLKNGFIGGGLETINTCAFDCIFSTYACLYQDYNLFRTFIDSSTSQLCVFITKVLKQQKVSNRGYIDRNKILYDLAGQSGKIKQLTKLDCETGFGGIFSLICQKMKFLQAAF